MAGIRLLSCCFQLHGRARFTSPPSASMFCMLPCVFQPCPREPAALFNLPFGPGQGGRGGVLEFDNLFYPLPRPQIWFAGSHGHAPSMHHYLMPGSGFYIR